MEESHTDYPALVFLRSPVPERSWMTAVGAVLDAAALWASAISGRRTAPAGSCVRAGYLARRRLAGRFDVAYDRELGCDEPTSIAREDFEAALEALADGRLPVVADREQAWRDFVGWRVEYDAVLVALAALVRPSAIALGSGGSPPDERGTMPGDPPRRARMTSGAIAELRERLAGIDGVVLLVGDVDTGKTTLGKLIAADAAAAGRDVVYVDGDVGAATVGPPACVGSRRVRRPEDFDGEADELRFVGSTTPQGVVLPHVVGVASLVDLARAAADLVVVDTTAVVAGVVGQTLKYHLAELCRPTIVVGMQRGAELEPAVGMLRRFLGVKVVMGCPPAEVVPLSPLERHKLRAEAFAAAFAPPLQRWRVQTTVFAPTLPEGFDVSRLDGMLVGVQDDRGRCLGLGALEHYEGTVRVVTRHGDAMRGLRLGSMRIDLETFDTTRVRLRQLIFGV